MPTQVTFQTELSIESFRTLRDELTALIGDHPGSLPTALAVTSVAGDDFVVDARELYQRLNPNLQSLLHRLVTGYDGARFTWDGVAADMDRPVQTVKSWYRSVSKSLNRFRRDHPSAPPLLAGQWDGTRNVYTVDPRWRAALQGI